jgi:hypothetical protein
VDGSGDTATTRRRCAASGWRLRAACTDGDGGAICPLCGQPVRAHRDNLIAGGVRIIQEHAT